MKATISVLALALLLIACKPHPAPDEQKSVAENTAPLTEFNINIDKQSAESLANQLWQKGLNHIQILEKEASVLHKKVKRLLSTPDDENLSETQKEWKRVFLLYQELLPFLFIEHPSLSKPLAKWRFTLAAWPLQPGYLDSYGVYTQSGIVNDISLPITVASLRKQHGLTDIEEVTLGLYAMEYLLWSDQKISLAKRFNLHTKVPLAFQQAGLKISELPNNRRRKLLDIQAKLLVKDISLLAKQWQLKGTLSTLYSNLNTIDKLLALHQGLLANLSAIDDLLLYEVDHIEEKNNAQKNLYPARFQINRQLAISKQIDAIEALYFSNATGHNAENTNSLATILLSEGQQEKLKLRIEAIKKQLTP